AAMPGFKALEKCPQLIIVPTRFEVYQSVSAQIRAIFGRFTDLIEPLSLDEAYLDVSHWRSDASTIAREIRRQIFEETQLTASAGIGPNKLIAKIASDLDKPNGQWTVTDVEGFMDNLPVAKLWGVGKKMQEKLKQHKISTCGDMQKLDKFAMSRRYGRWGVELYDLCRGIDAREVKVQRVRKSISNETTFSEDIIGASSLVPELRRLVAKVEESYQARYTERTIKSVVVKLKFADFTRTTIEKASARVDATLAETLLIEGFARGGGKAVRLLGVGIRLADEEDEMQLEMF
ncbi:MAG: DNA polymerase IV, partial [Rubritalea sp.]|uniref:DNA polymerase IV n=1 Tax=Rubritalea sp. TaxID=2109375 RepID=UPI003242B9EA